MRDLEYGSGPEKSCHDGMLRVCMNAAPRIAHVKCIPEQWSAGGLLEVQSRSTQKDAIGMWGWWWLGERKDEDVFGLDAFLLDS
jgi:hypothetical protein